MGVRRLERKAMPGITLCMRSKTNTRERTRRARIPDPQRKMGCLHHAPQPAVLLAMTKRLGNCASGLKLGSRTSCLGHQVGQLSKLANVRRSDSFQINDDWGFSRSVTRSVRLGCNRKAGLFIDGSDIGSSISDPFPIYAGATPSTGRV